MIAGRMEHKVTLLRPEYETDAYGSEKVRYVPGPTVWAERVKQSGTLREEVGEHFTNYRAEFNIRDAHSVGEHWRLRVVGGYEYHITAILPNRSRGMLTLMCERVNE